MKQFEFYEAPKFICASKITTLMISNWENTYFDLILTYCSGSPSSFKTPIGIDTLTISCFAWKELHDNLLNLLRSVYLTEVLSSNACHVFHFQHFSPFKIRHFLDKFFFRNCNSLMITIIVSKAPLLVIVNNSSIQWMNSFQLFFSMILKPWKCFFN